MIFRVVAGIFGVLSAVATVLYFLDAPPWFQGLAFVAVLVLAVLARRP